MAASKASKRSLEAEFFAMLDRFAAPVAGGDDARTQVEIKRDGQLRRYHLNENIDRKTKNRIEALAQIILKDPDTHFRVLTPMVAQTVDRATRSADGWIITDQALRFRDSSNEHVVEYSSEKQSREEMRKKVLAMNPRVADVWRLITAKALDAWKPDASEPPPMWLDVNELLNAMDIKKHVHGGYRPEHVQMAAEAISTLTNLWIIVPLGTKIFPTDGKSKRKPQVLTSERTGAVLLLRAVDQIRDLFDNKYPMRWHVQVGQWIQDFPPAFGPMLKALVELNTKGTVNVWTKAIGTELTYMMAEGRVAEFDVQVEDLLDRAGFLGEVKRMIETRNGGRARGYFEQALERLEQLNMFTEWRYDAEGFAAIQRAPRAEIFVRWLESRVVIAHKHAPRGLQTPTSN
jgi:hypothetical protein